MNEQSPESDLSCFFVYGTLKREQCRESCWPVPPLEIREGEVAGLLYDLGPYPALREGEGRVAGEVWIFDRQHEAAILRVLDRIEGYSDSPADLYQRVWVLVRSGESTFEAWTYRFCAEPSEFSRIEAVPAVWPV